jgi:protein phosphatase
MYIGHVGDSRCYRVRRGELRQMTRDHSLINDYLLAMPDLTEEQRSELPKNVITRALGMQDQVMVDLQSDEPQAGDMYLLCSDGLSGMIGEDEILDILMSTSDLDEACRRLVARANEHGGEDNITAIVVRIDNVVAPSDTASTEDERTTRATYPVPGSPAAASHANDAGGDKASQEPAKEPVAADVRGSGDLTPGSDR